MGWLARGWADLYACPLAGVLHGVVMAAFGLALLHLAGERFWLLAGAFSGFLLVAPVAATGLYAISRGRSRSESVGLMTAGDQLGCRIRRAGATRIFVPRILESDH